MFFIKVVRCPACGFTARNHDLKPNRTILLSHRNSKDQECENREMTVRVVSHPYPTMFRQGEQCEVFAPETLRFKKDDAYPLRLLHETKAVVSVIEEGPDACGTVLCRIPFGFKPEGAKTETNIMPILTSVLRRT